MAAANPYEPKTSSVTVQYVTPTATAPAFLFAYGESEETQTLAELSPTGVKVQANTLNTWP